jgi:hypothetical protein
VRKRKKYERGRAKQGPARQFLRFDGTNFTCADLPFPTCKSGQQLVLVITSWPELQQVLGPPSSQPRNFNSAVQFTGGKTTDPCSSSAAAKESGSSTGKI